LTLPGGEILVRDGKGGKDRRTVSPKSIQEELRTHLNQVQRRHELDLCAGAGKVVLPNVLSRKYPNADREWAWQWVFPASRRYREAETGMERRHHLHESAVQRCFNVRDPKPDSVFVIVRTSGQTLEGIP
jgi:hypothetical protein